MLLYFGDVVFSVARPCTRPTAPTFRPPVTTPGEPNAPRPAPAGGLPDTRGRIRAPATARGARGRAPPGGADAPPGPRSRARTSTGVTEPGTGTFSCSITSTGPNACLAAAMSALRCDAGCATSIRVRADPKTDWPEPCTLAIRPRPTVVPATATTSSARIRIC